MNGITRNALGGATEGGQRMNGGATSGGHQMNACAKCHLVSANLSELVGLSRAIAETTEKLYAQTTAKKKTARKSKKK